MQDLYHARKPGRNPQHFGSYRVLGLNPCQGRLQEELWCQLEPDMWLHTGHIQEGRCEALVMVAADLAVASVRHSLHLLYGTIAAQSSLTEKRPSTANGESRFSSWLSTSPRPAFGALPMTSCELPQ